MGDDDSSTMIRALSAAIGDVYGSVAVVAGDSHREALGGKEHGSAVECLGLP